MKNCQFLIVCMLLLVTFVCAQSKFKTPEGGWSYIYNGGKVNGSVLIGAIRWDAWHSHSTNPNDFWPVDAVEKTLGPKQYHYRAPFFAKIVDDSTVRIDGYTQPIVDQEIAYAKESGLDYWAFLLYNERTGNNYGYPMSEALHYYLTSSKKNDINFCVIESPDLLFRDPANEIMRVVRYIKEPNYQMVMGNRPLVYFYDMNDNYLSTGRQIMDNLRSQVIAAGFGDPYIVLQSWNISNNVRYLNYLGANAITRYGVGGEVNAKQSPYTSLTSIATNWWTSAENAGVQVIPIVTAGYDRRPRIQTDTFLAHLGYLSLTNYFNFPTNGELAAHLQDAVNWVKLRKSSTCPTGVILIYAWNEHDEGGWLCPTVDIGNGIDKSRINELKKISR